MVLNDIISQKRIILGSASPRRKELLLGLGIDFMVNPSNVDEEYSLDTPLEKIPEELAICKSRGYQETLKPEDILITADTLVICNHKAIGKPIDKEDAFNMLQTLSGNDHEVKTGVCIRSLEKETSFTATTEVTFKTLSNEEIEYYLENYKPYDKAGSYGVQEWIGYIAITGIKGSYYNVMGLPIQMLYSELIKFVST